MSIMMLTELGIRDWRTVTRDQVTLRRVDDNEAEFDPRTSVISDIRPWGHFDQLATNAPCTVKVISVDPGCRLSLQTHRFRGEMWRVMDGELTVTVGEDTWCAIRGDDIWVPRGAVHRMSNHTDTAVRVLELAFGHFNEDDIHRLEDDYAR